MLTVVNYRSCDHRQFFSQTSYANIFRALFTQAFPTKEIKSSISAVPVCTCCRRIIATRPSSLLGIGGEGGNVRTGTLTVPSPLGDLWAANEDTTCCFCHRSNGPSAGDGDSFRLHLFHHGHTWAMMPSRHKSLRSSVPMLVLTFLASEGFRIGVGLLKKNMITCYKLKMSACNIISFLHVCLFYINISFTLLLPIVLHLPAIDFEVSLYLLHYCNFRELWPH